MKVAVSKFDIGQIITDCLVVGVWQEQGKKALTDPVLTQVDQLTEGAIGRFLAKNKKFGEYFDSVHFYISPKKHSKIEKVLIAGLGKIEKLDNLKLKQIASYIGKQQTKGVKDLAIYFPPQAKMGECAEAVVIGFSSGIFDPGHHKTEKGENEKVKVENLTILVDRELAKVKERADLGLLIANSLHKVREVVNLPANIVTPQYMVKFAKKIAAEGKLKIQVFSEKQVNQMGMKIMASVAKGSEEDLYFVVMQYRGSTSGGKTLALVGKGITFDSGGISIKPSESMEWMKMDMAGAATVFGAMEVIAQLKPKIKVIAAVPLTENLLSGRATKPGDVVKGLAGKTVEIVNTDAEGRLVLADALTYLQQNFKPDYIVDVATLTGAVVIALGHWATAVLGRPQEFIDQVKEAALNAGERIWQLPLYDEYKEQLKSYIADVANVGGKPAGAETGAKFLEEFVTEKVNWAHLDIASTAWEENEKPYQSKGATGVMMATLVNLAIELAKQ